MWKNWKTIETASLYVSTRKDNEQMQNILRESEEAYIFDYITNITMWQASPVY